MKTLKLNSLNNNQLTKEQMKSVAGGDCVVCQCGCCYSTSGGSTVQSNGGANSKGGLHSTDCMIQLTIITCK